MRRKRIIALLAIVGIAAAAVAIPWSIPAGGKGLACPRKGPHYKLEGTWVGNAGGFVFSGTFVSASPANRTVLFSVDTIDNNPTFEGFFADVTSDVTARGLAVRTGPRTFDFTFNYYARDAEREIVYILISSGPLTLTDPDTYEAANCYSVFLAEQDADHDGLPDEGQEPILCVPAYHIAKRLHVIPPCEPAL